MKYEICHVCNISYNVSSKRKPGNIFVCQDCTERDLARMQGRRPRCIYGGKKLATVIYERKN